MKQKKEALQYFKKRWYNIVLDKKGSILFFKIKSQNQRYEVESQKG